MKLISIENKRIRKQWTRVFFSKPRNNVYYLLLDSNKNFAFYLLDDI